MRKLFAVCVATAMCTSMFAANINAAPSGIELNADNFPDINLRKALAVRLDENGDNIITEDEHRYVISSLSLQNVSDLTGLELIPEIIGVTLESTPATELTVTRNIDDYFFLKIDGAPTLRSVKLRGKGLFDLKITECPNLTSVDLADPGEQRACTGLSFIDCKSLENVDISPTKDSLDDLEFTDCPKVDSIDLKGFNLKNLKVVNCPISELYLKDCSKLGNLKVLDTNVKELDLTGCPILCEVDLKDLGNLNPDHKSMVQRYNSNTLETSIGLRCKCGEVYSDEFDYLIKDSVLCEELRSECDADKDGRLSTGERARLINYTLITNDPISSVDGMELFTNLEYFSSAAVSYDKFDLGKIPAPYVSFSWSEVKDLIIPDNCGVETLYIQSTDLGRDDIDLGYQPDLTNFTLWTNHDVMPKTIDIRKCPRLVDAYENGVKSEETQQSTNYTQYTKDDVTLAFMPSIKILSRYAVNVSASNGSVSGAGEYRFNDQVTLKAAPADGYEFDGWYESDKLISSDASMSFKAESDRNIVAKFSKIAVPTAIPTAAPTSAAKPTASAQPTTAAKPTASAQPTDAASASSENKILAFVERIYRFVLDREPETEGATFWSEELYAFRRTGAEVAQGFIFSPEFENRKTTDEQFVTILYKTFFGRDPEEEGMKFWLNQLSTGAMDRVTVANGFIYSQEWADTCASYGIRSGGDLKPTGKIAPTELTYAFVERMYTTAMGRGYDEEGRQYWASELANFNITGEQCGASFFLSAEMEGYGLSDEEFLGRLYATFMNREADADGQAYWLSQMSAGVTRADIVFGFTRSPEFSDKCIEARILPF